MLIFRVALKNLLGQGLRTWLIAIVLSFAYVIIIFLNGIYDGWNHQARTDMIAWEIGQGQIWHEAYDPFDPFTLQDAHGIPGFATAPEGPVPILVRQAQLFPKGRQLPAMLKGIDPNQTLLDLPTAALRDSEADIPAIIGKRMAKAAKLEVGESVTIRWRDKNGTFDATQIVIAEIFDCNVPRVDNGQIWLSIDDLQEMTGMKDEATFFVVGDKSMVQDSEGWSGKGHDFLLEEMDNIIASKRVGGSIMYLMILAIALLAIFDTQILSIFRRKREIGTYIALGMTRQQVIALFTVEGGATSILAAALATLYGFPLFVYMARNGFAMPVNTDDYGLAIAEKIFPVYSVGLVAGTLVFIVIAATIVSFLPSRKIAKMNPTDALKGKVS